MGKLDTRIRRTYSNLNNTLYELLTEKSFEEITVSELCDKSHVHRATFYKHFEDKYNFLKFFFKYQLNDIDFNDFSDSDEPHIIFKERCIHLADNSLEFIELNPQIFDAFFDKKSSIAFSTTITDSLTEFLAERLKSYANIEDTKIDLFVNYYAFALIGIARWYLLNRDNFSREDFKKFYSSKIEEMSENYRLLLS